METSEGRADGGGSLGLELRKGSVEVAVVVEVELRRNVRGERETEVVVAAIFSG